MDPEIDPNVCKPLTKLVRTKIRCFTKLKFWSFLGGNSSLRLTRAYTVIKLFEDLASVTPSLY